MYVKPKPGYKIPDPDMRDMLPAIGRDVAPSPYWTRRLRDGDVITATAPIPPDSQASSEPSISSGLSVVSTGLSNTSSPVSNISSGLSDVKSSSSSVSSGLSDTTTTSSISSGLSNSTTSNPGSK